MKKILYFVLVIASIASVYGLFVYEDKIEEYKWKEYDYAVSLYRDGDYFAAYHQFDSLGDWRNSKEYKELCIQSLKRMF